MRICICIIYKYKFSGSVPELTGFTWYIFQVDMDMEDDLDDAVPAAQGREAEKVVGPLARDDASNAL